MFVPVVVFLKRMLNAQYKSVSPPLNANIKCIEVGDWYNGALKSKHDRMPWVNNVDMCCVQRWRHRVQIHFDTQTHIHMSGNSIRLGYRLLTTYNTSWLCIPPSIYVLCIQKTTYSVCIIPSEHNMRRCKMSVPKPAIRVKRLKMAAIQSNKCMEYTNNHPEVGSDMWEKSRLCILALTLVILHFLQ